MLVIFDYIVRAACLFFALWFVVSYSKVAWKASLEGRHLMWFTRMLACFIGLTFLYRLIPLDVYIWISRALFVWLGYLLFRRVQLQRHAQREEDSESDTPELNTSLDSEYQEEGR